MRSLSKNDLVWCVVALVSLVLGVWGWQLEPKTAFANELNNSSAGSGGLVTHVVQSPDRLTQVIVVDSIKKRMAVYFISQSGEIQLMSARNISADLEIQEFNSGDPSPLDIEKIQKRN